jgi:hypothetical protein
MWLKRVRIWRLREQREEGVLAVEVMATRWQGMMCGTAPGIERGVRGAGDNSRGRHSLITRSFDRS